MLLITEEIRTKLSKNFPAGTRIELVRMDDPQAPPVGTRCTVWLVDLYGSLIVDWDNGSRLNVLYGKDAVRIIK